MNEVIFMDVDNDHKTTYLSCVSHEIRSILSIIMGACDMAKRHINDVEKVSDFLNRISSNAYKVVKITDELMEMGKDAAEDITECESFFINELAYELKTLMEPLADEKEIRFEVTLLNISTESVRSDYGRLLHMMVNIVSNAIKYTPAGGMVEVIFEETGYIENDLSCYRFSCHDTGIGIPDEFLEYIFEPFSRADDERIAAISGTGLGMMIVKEIVEKLGGSIHIDSAINKGTTVAIELSLPKNYTKRPFI